MSRNVNIPALVNCPKCGAGRTIAQYRHVEGGVCFLCNGDGKVTAAQAAGWERAQIKEALWAKRAVGVVAVAATPARASKAVDLGLAFIRPGAKVSKGDDAGWYMLDCEIEAPDYHGEDCVTSYTVHFQVVAGRVVVGDVQNGVKPFKGRIEKALQAALKV